MSEPFDRLHPALQHHIVNSLGWRSLRPLQTQAIEPLLVGSHALLLAPTAGGKTEAAIFPVLSRMLTEDWRGLSVIYVCPIKALLNNLEERLSKYAGLLGRTVAMWHGDVGPSARKAIINEPPDILLTTPESIEVMLIFRSDERERLFGDLRCLIVDEIHAFAGDDRGWHLLAVMERVTRMAGREIQRLGLSATIGNPDELLDWLAGYCEGDRVVINPAAEASAGGTDIELDYVGSTSNAAIVISRLHRGEKRLVFCDSRSRVEQLATELRQHGVQTFVSHSSLALDERRRAEEAFSQAQNCVIVATSTLELGVDVGDLDRVIQIDAPSTVASFLQRLGRTGRRTGTKRNCLFLATSENALMKAAGLLRLWESGFVEPVQPPPEPYHLLAQQIMALCLQEGRIGRATWQEWIGRVSAFASMASDDVEAIVQHMVDVGILFEDEGMLAMGAEGETTFGRKNFLELCSVFTSPPLFKVLHGRTELGYVHETTFLLPRGDNSVLSLAGRGWTVKHVDWRRRVAFVEPTADRGKSRWMGSSPPMQYGLCQSVRAVLAADDEPEHLTRRARGKLAELRDDFAWLDPAFDGTYLVRHENGKQRWWTFAGAAANGLLAAHLGQDSAAGRVENLFVRLDYHVEPDALPRPEDLETDVRGVLSIDAIEAVAKGLKFSECLPAKLLEKTVGRMAWDASAATRVASGVARSVVVSGAAE